MSRIQEHGLCINAGYGFLLLGIGLCLYQMYFCAMYKTWEFVIGKSYNENPCLGLFFLPVSGPFFLCCVITQRTLLCLGSQFSYTYLFDIQLYHEQ